MGYEYCDRLTVFEIDEKFMDEVNSFFEEVLDKEKAATLQNESAIKIYLIEYVDIAKAKQAILQTYSQEHDGMRYSIDHADKGRPLLKREGERYGEISVSHTANMLAIAFSDMPIGIDLEKRDREIDKRVCDSIEHWTRYEAYGKWLGEGISRKLLKGQLPDKLLRTRIINDVISAFAASRTSPTALQ